MAGRGSAWCDAATRAISKGNAECRTSAGQSTKSERPPARHNTVPIGRARAHRNPRELLHSVANDRDTTLIRSVQLLDTLLQHVRPEQLATHSRNGGCLSSARRSVKQEVRKLVPSMGNKPSDNVGTHHASPLCGEQKHCTVASITTEHLRCQSESHFPVCAPLPLGMRCLSFALADCGGRIEP